MLVAGKQAPASAPGASDLAMDQVNGALRAGDIAEAERVLRSRLLQAPQDVGAIAKLAELAATQGRLTEAMVLLGKALAIAPAAHPLRLQLVRLHQQQADFAAAIMVIEQLPPPLRDTFELKLQKAALLGQLGRRGQEIALYEELVRQQPRNPRLLMSLGNALNYAGRAKEAVRALRRAIKSRASNGEAWWSLANLKSFRFDDRDIAAMKRALKGNVASDDALHFHFALGRAFEQREDYQQSFDHYLAGNRLRSETLQPDQLRVTSFVDAAIATFNEPLFNRYGGAGCQARGPIFIIGLQRSGSTLIEQILASHPQIEGTSELLAMQQLWADVARRAAANGRNVFQQVAYLDPAAIQRTGEEYLERTAAFRRLDRSLFVDKLPANWLNVGLIRLALPNAKIIDARRNPMACGFSNFKQHYANGATYAYSLPSIGYFYRDYLRLMEHFDAVQPGAIHHVVNERLIEDPEREIRRMLDYVGVPFDPACLDFHNNKRAVHTPSAEQVRLPINRDGVDAWRAYERWLDSLKEALGPALNGWIPAQA